MFYSHSIMIYNKFEREVEKNVHFLYFMVQINIFEMIFFLHILKISRIIIIWKTLKIKIRFFFEFIVDRHAQKKFE